MIIFLLLVYTDNMQRYFDIDSGDYLPNQTLEDYYWTEFKEDANTPAGAVRYSISTTNTNAKMRLGKAYLEVQCNISKDNGTAFTGAGGFEPHLAPINSAWHLFSGVRAILGSQQIYNSKYTGKEHLMRHLVKYNKEYAKTVGSQVIFYPDTAGDEHLAASVTDVLLATAVEEAGMYKSQLGDGLNVQNAANNGTTVAVIGLRDNPDYNSGFKKRVDQFVVNGALKTVTLWLPLSEVLTFFEDYDRVMTGLRFELELDKNEAYTDILFGDARAAVTTATPKINITSLSLWVPTVKESVSIAPELTEKFLSSSRTIMYRHVNSYRSNLFTHGDGVPGSWNVTTETAKPLKAYVGFQFADRATNYKLNSGQFDSLFSDIWLNINSEIIPRDTHKSVLNANGSVGKFSRILQDIYRAGDKDLDDEESSIINYQNWAKIYPIVVFDLEQLGESLFKKSVAHIELNWVKRGAGDYRVFLILETERAMKIDYAQNRANIMWK